MRATGVDDVTVLAQKAAAGAVRFAVPAKKAEAPRPGGRAKGDRRRPAAGRSAPAPSGTG
jgi:beta-lysine 5,6-aminomutase alpha subunit